MIYAWAVRDTSYRLVGLTRVGCKPLDVVMRILWDYFTGLHPSLRSGPKSIHRYGQHPFARLSPVVGI